MTPRTLWLPLLCVVAFGTLLSVWDLIDTRRERRQLIEAHRTTGLLWINAHGNWRTALFTLGVFGCFTVASLFALLTEVDNVIRQYVIRVALPLAVTLLTFKRLFDRLDRRRITSLQRVRHDVETAVGADLALIGGRAVIQQISTEFYSRLLRDDQLKHYFEGVRVTHLIHAQTTWLVDLLSDRISMTDLKQAHAHLGISVAHFDRFVDMFRGVLVDFNVAEPIASRILENVMHARDQIVAAPREET